MDCRRVFPKKAVEKKFLLYVREWNTGVPHSRKNKITHIEKSPNMFSWSSTMLASARGLQAEWRAVA